MNDGITRPAGPQRNGGHESLSAVRCITIAVLVGIALAGCGTPARRAPSPEAPPRGGYYLDDGPGAQPPSNLDSIPEPTPRVEPLNRGTMRPYVVMGKQYTPMTSVEPYRARGVASWYGRRYHGKRTASGEIYDMYQVSAAHPVLPIPSYARVTNLRNGRSIIVRINDRGPFLDNREIDLSYTAAYKLGILAKGSGMVEVESIMPGAEAVPVVASATQVEVCCAPPAVDTAAAPVANESTMDAQAIAAAPAPATPAGATDASPRVASAPAPLTSDASGIYLQLGAFGSRQNAESFLARLQAQVAWLAETIHIFARGDLYRVHVGPYASRDEARSAADRISQTLGVKPFVFAR